MPTARPPLDRAAEAGAVPPAWARELVGPPTSSSEAGSAGAVHVVRSKAFLLARACIADASAMDGPALESAAAQAYDALADALRADPPWHPIRIWNFVPRILDPGGEGMDRYMRFNAGRYRAFTKWFGGSQGFDRVLPAASAVGHAGGDLVVHLLAARTPGNAVGNPRQISPHRYSKRFGPLPPCFARATRLVTPDGRALLLAGGTASIVGEDSVHVGDLRLQLGETFENLAALVRSAFGPSDRPLERYRELRVYYVRATNLPALREAVAQALPRVQRPEWMCADLCRGDLRVEIEGLAQAV